MSENVVRLHKCVAAGALDSSIFAAIHTDAAALQECEVLDFKQQVPLSNFEYAKTARDLVALHNSYGGFLVFGVGETQKDREFELIGVDSASINIGKLRDLLRAYTGSELRIQASSLVIEGKCLEVVWIAKRSVGESPVKFARNGPEEQPGKVCFKRDEVVFRRIENNAVALLPDDYDFLYSPRRPPSIELSATDFTDEDPLEHNLPDRTLVCSKFVGRRENLGELWAWLSDDFSRVRLIAGEGGLGKTSLAYRFAEEVASRRVKPFGQVVWLTAKKRQFIAAEDSYRENSHINFFDADSLLKAIATAHGCIDSDFEGLDARDLLQLALESCLTIPSFLVIDDVDSLTPADQQRALELGMRTPAKTKMLLTTRVNFSYSPDNVLKINGLEKDEFKEYVKVVRQRYSLAEIKDAKVEHLREVSGGSPLFTDSLLRHERRGLTLEQAINQWRGEKGLEVRKAALQREIQQLSREAKRTLYVISYTKSISYVELLRILDYAEQTLGDALQELAGLFLVSAPSIGKEARYTVESNTGLLVIELAQSLGIDHAALVGAIKRARTDAVGLSFQRRSGIVGLAIAQAIAFLKDNQPTEALKAVLAANKKLTKPNADLLLAIGRFSLKQTPPQRSQASKAFTESYALGQRKQLLFELWFEAEYGNGSLELALEVTKKAVDYGVGDVFRWYERSAQVHVALARRSESNVPSDSAIREVELAVLDLKRAKELCSGDILYRQMDQLLDQAMRLRSQLFASR